MFNLNQEVDRLQQLKYSKVHGLPYKRQQKDLAVAHLDGTLFDIIAEQESKTMGRAFRNRSKDFGQRLSKRKGEYHKPGGGFAGYTGTTIYH